MIAEELIRIYVEEHKEETIELLKALTQIPSPSGMEQWRAEYITNWLVNHGAEDVITDKAGNVICLYNCSKNCDLIVISAHMDTVFSIDTPLDITEKDGRLFAPGIGDDTANLVNMLMTIRFLTENDYVPESKTGILFAANVGEEGLGNLKGSRAICDAYGDRIRMWVAFDLYCNGLYNKAVGSYRYKISVRTQGGHSFRDFGKTSAIAAISDLVGRLYRQDIPNGSRTTLNVGRIEGGTSVNSIAEEASVLYEFRSVRNDHLEEMKRSFERIMEEFTYGEAKTETTLLGVRPGQTEVDQEKEDRLCACILAAMKKYYGGEIEIQAASTDCNIPLSRGIPAAAFGTVMGGGIHTTEEWIEKESMIPGQKMAIYAVLLSALKGKNNSHKIS